MAKDVTIKILGDASSLERALGQAQSGLSKLGGAAKLAGIAVAAGAATVAVSSTKAAVEFESAMGQVFTLLPDISGAAMDTMNDQVLAFSKQMGILPDEVVPALYDALSAGVPQDNVFEFMEVAGKAAIGGNLEVADAVDLLSTAVNAYAESGLTAAEASDLFFTTVRLGKTTVPELQKAFSNVGPVAAALGVGLDEVGAALAVLTASGVPTAQATTQIRGAIAELGKSGTVAAKAFEELSGQTFNEFIEQGGTFSEALQMMADSGEPVIDMFGSIEAAQAVMALTANEGEALSKALEEMGSAAGATDGAFETMEGTTGRSMERIKANLAAVQVQIGDRLLPAFAKATDWVVAHWPQIEQTVKAGWEKIQPVYAAYGDAAVWVVAKFREHWPQIQAVIGDVVTWIEDVSWPIVQKAFGLIMEASAEIVALVQKHWPQIRQTVVDAIEAVRAGIEVAVKAIKYVWERWGEAITKHVAETWAAIQKAIGGALDIIQGVFRAFKALFEGDWSELWAAVKQIFDGAVQVLVAAFEALWSRMKLAVTVAWDLIKTEVWNGIQALPGLFVKAHMLLWRAAYDLLVKAKDGVVAALKIAASEVDGFVRGLPGTILHMAGELYAAGKVAFEWLVDGMGDALAALPGVIADKVLGPLDEIIEKVGDVISAVGGVVGIGGGGGSKTAGTAPKNDDAAQEKALLAASKFKPFAHGGPLVGGKSYLVGERGPELLHVPNGMGGSNIVSNQETGMGGGATINVNVNGSTASPEQIGAAVLWSMRMAG